jgi:hypothetical protein
MKEDLFFSNVGKLYLSTLPLCTRRDFTLHRHCSKNFVPHLQVIVYAYRMHPVVCRNEFYNNDINEYIFLFY